MGGIAFHRQNTLQENTLFVEYGFLIAGRLRLTRDAAVNFVPIYHLMCWLLRFCPI